MKIKNCFICILYVTSILFFISCNANFKNELPDEDKQVVKKIKIKTFSSDILNSYKGNVVILTFADFDEDKKLNITKIKQKNYLHVLNYIYQDYRDSGVVVIGIPINEYMFNYRLSPKEYFNDENLLYTLISFYKITFPIYHFKYSLTDLFNMKYIPTTIIFDKNMKEIKRFNKRTSESDIINIINKLI